MGQLSTKVDVVVIGAGPGGYTAAIRAVQLGLEVLLIEKDKLGGTCTNIGCIPTKALLHAADVKHEAESQSARKMGISVSVKIDYKKTKEWKDGVVTELRTGIETLCKLNGVETLKGSAFFTSSSTLSVETETGIRAIEFNKAIIATGTSIRPIDELPFDHKKVIDSTDCLELTEIPKKLIVVGGGYIAVEMANMFLKFGSKATIVHRGDKLLKTMEPDVTEVLLNKIKEFGGEVLFKSQIEKIIPSKNHDIALVKTPNGTKELEFEKIIVAAGRTANLSNLGLEKTKIKLNEDGLIIVNEKMQTADPNIYAVGDIVPGPQLAHKAFREAKVAAEVIAGQNSAFDNRAIPMVVFSDPEIAVVGLTEEEAIQKGHKVLVGKMPFSALGKAKAINRPEGFAKVIADENGIILGVHIVGAGAGGLIAEAALAIETAATLEDLATTIHAHPTLPEALAEAAEDALKKAIHIYKKKK